MKKHYIKQSNPQTIHSLFMLPDLFSSFLLILLQLIHFSNNFHFHYFTSFSFCLSLSLTVSIFFSIHLYLSLFACLTLFLSVSLNLLLSVSLLFYPSLCIHLFPSFCLLLQSPSLCISLCPSMCLFLSLSLLLSSIFTSHLFVCLFPSLFLFLSPIPQIESYCRLDSFEQSVSVNQLLRADSFDSPRCKSLHTPSDRLWFVHFWQKVHFVHSYFEQETQSDEVKSLRESRKWLVPENIDLILQKRFKGIKMNVLLFSNDKRLN